MPVEVLDAPDEVVVVVEVVLLVVVVVVVVVVGLVVIVVVFDVVEVVVEVPGLDINMLEVGVNISCTHLDSHALRVVVIEVCASAP